MRHACIRFALLSVGLLACGDDAVRPAATGGEAGGGVGANGGSGAEGAGAGGTGGGDAGGGDAGGGGAAPCTVNEVPLELTISPDGVADSQVIPVRYRGEEAYLGVDTGSPYTFVFGPEGAPELVEHVGDVEVGCELFPVDQITLEALEPEPFNGKLIIGIVGMNFFSQVPTELDYPGGLVVRHLAGDAPARGLVEVPVAWNGTRIVVDASLDDEAVRLLYDAGSPHTIWVGQEGQPGDQEVVLGTADGGTTTVFEGTAALAFAGDEVVVPVWRAPSFPYIEEELIELDADGLLGATGLGFRRVVFDLAQERMHLGPRVRP
jgi:hypothetical protein